MIVLKKKIFLWHRKPCLNLDQDTDSAAVWIGIRIQTRIQIFRIRNTASGMESSETGKTQYKVNKYHIILYIIIMQFLKP